MGMGGPLRVSFVPTFAANRLLRNWGYGDGRPLAGVLRPPAENGDSLASILRPLLQSARKPEHNNIHLS